MRLIIACVCAMPHPLLKAGAAEQVRKSRIGADWVEVGMYFEELQNIRLLLIGLLEPGESLVVFAKPQISVHKSGRGNVTRRSAFLQFREEPKSFRAPPSVGIRPDQHADDGRTAVRNRDALSPERGLLLRVDLWQSARIQGIKGPLHSSGCTARALRNSRMASS